MKNEKIWVENEKTIVFDDLDELRRYVESAKPKNTKSYRLTIHDRDYVLRSDYEKRRNDFFGA